jgi:uncharacterized protein
LHRRSSRLLLSASDLVAFHDCGHLTQLDRRALDDPDLRTRRCADDEHAQLIQRKGHEFEARYLARLEATHPDLIKIDHADRDPDRLAAETLAAMRTGAPVIYQATLLHEDLVGHADFLRRVERPSALGDWSYEVIDTKLARSEKPKFVLQLCFYSELLALAQGAESQAMHVVLGTGDEVSYRCADYTRYFRRLLQRFREALADTDPNATYPDPCERCPICHWRELCEARREQDDSLWLVADIRSSQVQKLQAAGVHTLTALAELPANHTVPKLALETFAKLRGQAALQLAGRGADQPLHELLAPEDGHTRGFARLPLPDDGDVYLDMEGDPLHGDDGLEYLFGVYYRDGKAGAFEFKPFWGHTRAEEKQAFERFMDWLDQRRRKHPGLHVYHYAAYEDTALKKLSSRHATREALLDTFLRERRLVDLYKVVRESIRASTPSYSIKDIEKFYREAREGDVQTAGASIVYYERYLETGDESLFEKIERYNEDDVVSLQLLHQWLLAQRRPGMPWRGDGSAEGAAGAAAGAPSPKLQAYLDDVEKIRAPLLADLPDEQADWTPAQHSRALMADLLEFHRRNEKPQWWEMFARTELPFDDLLDSVDAIAGLTKVKGTPDEYEYPPQEIKFEAGESAVWLEHPETANVKVLEVDEDRRRVRLAPTRKSGKLPDALSLGKGGPLDAGVLKAALLRVGQSISDGDHRYRALEAVFEKQLPRLKGRKAGQPIVRDEQAPLEQTIDAVRRLDGSYLFIQGPPGSGKTYTGSHVVAALLAEGKRVAVSSNSHKAINNLLRGVEEVLLKQGQRDVRAAKKCSRGDDSQRLKGQLIVDVDENEVALDDHWQLVAGTAWLLARPEADQQFDYLFVDEAGQVSLANLAAMGACARNIVLLGDQMQLGQPIQGVHPGRSGESSLEYLLDGHATVPPERGVFLPITWRMCPDVCQFISDAVYDGRLFPEEKNAHQRLALGTKPHPALRPTGVVFWPMSHTGCGQRSPEEAEEIERIYQSLLKQSWIDRSGKKQRITPDDILVVAPYNLQVNLLKRVLPDTARVGTVDKFQGQEAAVSLISMTTSSEADLPRHLEFLFSKNRLNVAISRARCLSVVVANPKLLDTRCRTPGEIALVNTLCWAAES